jgi:protein-L-isoaspartate(D-aspartate) O-methyltransferase
MKWILGLLMVLNGWSLLAQPARASRERMVREQIEARGVTNATVLAALRAVPREEFVPASLRFMAFSDGPVAIGYGQTISQPNIVALMTDLLGVGRGAKVLEVGTGSGYQAAVLAQLGCKVWTVEIVPELADSGAERLRRLGYGGVTVKAGDGYLGWPEHAPFDAVIVTCAVEPVPPPLVEQLKPGGRLVIPLGEPGEAQTLAVLRKEPGGRMTRRDVLPVLFVPLVRPRE